jgi:hypothetical protein
MDGSQRVAIKMATDKSAAPGRRERRTVNLRADPEMRLYLDRAAAAHEQSLSGEIEERLWFVRIVEAALGAPAGDEDWSSPLSRLLAHLAPLLPEDVMTQIHQDAVVLADAPGHYVYHTIALRIYNWRLQTKQAPESA